MSKAIARLNAELEGRYRVLREIGSGGMATVYLAEDLKHGRDVAVKVLHARLASSVGSERFLREIRVSARLNHPHILTLIDSGQAGDALFYVIPFVDGESIRAKLDREKRVDLQETATLIRQVASALDYAHQQGVIHRDIKPENILLHRGVAMVSDFGIAVGLQAAQADRLTEEGASLGTPSYMSPEQVEGSDDIDPRSDVYAVGCLAYEMLAGTPPFTGASTQALLAKILTADPQALTEIRTDVPVAVSDAVARAIARPRDDRFPTAGDFSARLAEASLPVATSGSSGRWGAAVAAAALAGFVAWQALAPGSTAASTASALAEIDRLVAQREWVGAWDIASEIEGEVSDTTMERIWSRISSPTRVVTEPAGAMVSWRPYGATEEAWRPLGPAPVEARLPQELVALRLEHEGYQTRFIGSESGMAPIIYWTAGEEDTGALGDFTWTLMPAGSEPSGVVHIPSHAVDLSWLSSSLWTAPVLTVDDYLIDEHEVTNGQYQTFVDDDGYEREELWDHPFESGSATLPFGEAMSRFTDQTGRRGPSTWEVGSYPPGMEDYPVTGVSWYEAAAYAKWAGRSLPTIYHWYAAAATHLGASVIPFSNLDGVGLSPVGEHPVRTPFGPVDMAGNAREWVFNQDRNLRYTAGGGYTDAGFYFEGAQPQPAFDRSVTNGFRLITDLGSPERFAELSEPVNRATRDFRAEQPVSNDVFEFFRQSYAYDDTPLNETIERTDTVAAGIRQRIVLDAAYGGERLALYLFLPLNRDPELPLQTVVYMPGSGALTGGGIDGWSNSSSHPAFLTRSGRAVAFPVYRSVWEREDDYFYQRQDPSNEHRDHVMMWRQDIGRTIDYLETRDDIDVDRLSYFGHSWGGRMGAIMLALEPRFQAGVLYVAGLSIRPTQPAAEPLNFLPRVRVPVLMLNGEFDTVYPLATQSRPFLDLLGSEVKRQHVEPGGHSVPYNVLIRETLGWLDEHVGLVR